MRRSVKHLRFLVVFVVCLFLSWNIDLSVVIFANSVNVYKSISTILAYLYNNVKDEIKFSNFAEQIFKMNLQID